VSVKLSATATVGAPLAESVTLKLAAIAGLIVIDDVAADVVSDIPLVLEAVSVMCSALV
jgi:hypothetical protein